jgi:hypothetical protein
MTSELKYHAMWIGGDPGPVVAMCLESLIKTHSTRETLFWTDTLDNKPSLAFLRSPVAARVCIKHTHELDAEARLCFRSVYEALDSGYKFRSMYSLLVDMYRLIAIRRYGGVYVDADTFILRNMDDLFATRKSVFVAEGPGDICSGIFGSLSEHASALNALIALGSRKRNFNEWGFLGPRLFTEYCRQNGDSVTVVDHNVFFSRSHNNLAQLIGSARNHLDISLTHPRARGLHLAHEVMRSAGKERMTVTIFANVSGRQPRAISAPENMHHAVFSDALRMREQGSPSDSRSPAYDVAANRLSLLRESDWARYLQETHLEVIGDVIHIMQPTAESTLIEFGGGHLSTPLLLETGAKVVTVELVNNVPTIETLLWIAGLKEHYARHRNWCMRMRPASECWSSEQWPDGADLCILGGRSNDRKEVVEHMLALRIPVVVAQGLDRKSCGYDDVACGMEYLIHEYRGREVWTRVWSRNCTVSSALSADPMYRLLGAAANVDAHG